MYYYTTKSINFTTVNSIVTVAYSTLLYYLHPFLCVGKVFIKKSSGETVGLTVSMYESIHSVKTKIKQIIGITVEQQQLVHSGRTLSDDDILETYEIHYGDTITLVLKSGGKD